MSRRSDFVVLTRQLASQFIDQSDQYKALVAEFTFSGYGAPTESGGLGPDDFTGANDGLNRQLIVDFYTNLGQLLSTITEEQSVVFYRVRS